MQGNRVYDKAPHELKPGEYSNWNGLWVICTPNGKHGNITKHTVVEHEDGTLTVSPSILINTSIDGGKTWIEEWHGFLEHGVWRTC